MIISFRFNPSYQLMAFSSALVLVGVLYLSSTNQSKDACKYSFVCACNLYQSNLFILELELNIFLLITSFLNL